MLIAHAEKYKKGKTQAFALFMNNKQTNLSEYYNFVGLPFTVMLNFPDRMH